MRMTVTEEELLAKVAELNADEDIDGIIVQLPLAQTHRPGESNRTHRSP
jgi:5,10-methylene-tetrahydrofolate dehydrogenase/methenyl tetrahydrofolate cyclohydrolase